MKGLPTSSSLLARPHGSLDMHLSHRAVRPPSMLSSMVATRIMCVPLPGLMETYGYAKQVVNVGPS